MPLVDHFHPPLSAERRWESFLSSWATKIADTLTEQWLPPNSIAEEHVHLGPSVEIDVGTFEQEACPLEDGRSGSVATLSPRWWTPPAAEAVLPAVFPETFEVRILCRDTGPKLVAAIELISPGNKDRAAATPETTCPRLTPPYPSSHPSSGKGTRSAYRTASNPAAPSESSR